MKQAVHKCVTKPVDKTKNPKWVQQGKPLIKRNKKMRDQLPLRSPKPKMNRIYKVMSDKELNDELESSNEREAR